MRIAAALSEHPLATHAVGECAGAVLERHGTGPDLAVLFVTGAHAGAMEDIAAAVRSLLGPSVLIGTTAVSVLGGAREVEEQPAVALWCGWFDRPVTPIRLAAEAVDGGVNVAGLGALDGAEGTLLLLVDPFAMPVEAVLEHLGSAAPGLAVVGGFASSARGPGGNRLALDGRIETEGAVGALLPPDIPVQAVVSQGCRPIGDPFTVTGADGPMLLSLAGRPALEVLMELIEALPDRERALAAQGLHVGIVADEQRDEFRRGDFLIRGVMGADRARGAVAVGAAVEVGTTVQFQVRDADTADEDLRGLLAAGSELPAGSLAFTCNGRGMHLFGVPHHDASVISEYTGDAPLAGMFCAGELGPVGGRNFIHGFTASIALFGSL